MIARVASFAAALALSAGILTGCAGTPPDISSDTSEQMQTTVVSIGESAAAGDAAHALAQLDELQQQLDAALAGGSVSADRAAAIQSRMDLVRADLQPEPEPAPVVEPDPDPTADDDDDNGDSGNENSGPGNDNGKDKDKDD